MPGLLVNHFRAGDIGRHQVRRKLNALKRKVQGLRQSADQQRLGQSRHTNEQRMAPGKDGDENFIDDLLLADNDLG